MKKKLSLIPILLLLFAYKASSQEYLPFPQDSAIWYTVDYDYNPTPPPLATFNTYIYEADGDTLINGTIYTKLYNAYENYPSTYEGAYRVDNINSRVYFIDSFYNTEGLLYDFSLVPGDTIPVINGTDTAFHVVCLDTASILINNFPHLALSILSYTDYGYTCYTVWVKGIGSMKHPLETEMFCADDLFETSYFLNCFFYNDEKIYQEPNNPFFEGCYGNWVGIDDVSMGEFQIFPNPASDLINIQLPDTFISPGILRIYNNFGETVLRREFSGSNNNFAINVSNFINGIYFISINSNSTTISTKLIVNH